MDPVTILLGSLVSGIMGAAGNGPQRETTNSTSSSSGQQAGSSTQNNLQTSTPTLTPEAQELMRAIQQQYMGNLTGPDIGGYRQTGINQINRSAGLQDVVTRNALAARGLNYSPVAGVVAANNEGNRLNQINDFTAGIPLIQDQLRNANLGAAANFFRSIPTGAETRSDAFSQFSNSTQSNSKQNSETTKPGQRLAGGISGLAAGFLQGLFGGKK